MGSSLAWVTRMTSFACQGSCFFSRRFSDLIYEIGSNALIQLMGRTIRHPIRIHPFVCKRASSVHSKRASVSCQKKWKFKNWLTASRRVSMVTLWLSNRTSRYNLIYLPWTYLATRRIIFRFKRKDCQGYRVR